MKRATLKRDRRLKTIKSGIYTTKKGLFKKLIPWLIIGGLGWIIAIRIAMVL